MAVPQRAGVLAAAIIALTFAATRVTATPNRARHIRTILLGVDRESYFTLTVETDNLGTYYSCLDSVFVNRIDFTGRRLDRQLVRARTHADSSAHGHRVITEHVPHPLNVDEFLLRHGASHVMPSEELEPCLLALADDGLFLTLGMGRRPLLPAAEVARFLLRPKGEWALGRYAIENYFWATGKLLLIIQGPGFCCDSDAEQAVIPVDAAQADKARRELLRDRHRAQPGR
jgi:hypothetical protein